MTMHWPKRGIVLVAAAALMVGACGSSTASTAPSAAASATAAASQAASTAPSTAPSTAATEAPSASAAAVMADAITIFTPGGAAPDFDPAMGSVNQYNFLAPVYDPLIRRDSDGKFEPSLATEWAYTTPAEFTMTIRDGVKFTDGTALDATAVKANIQNVQNGKGSYAAQFKSITAIDVVDATHLKLTLSAPNPSLPVLFSTSAGMIASPAALGKDALHTTPVGTGAYTYDATNSVANDTLIYNIRADAWNVSHYHFKTVTLKIFSDENAAANALISGDAAYTELGQAGTVTKVQGASNLKTSLAAYNVWGLGLLDRDGKVVPALKDVRVRQAINYAIDREALVKTAQQGLGAATDQLVKDWMEGYDKSLDGTYPYDPAKAKQLLSDAGFASGFSADVVSLSFFDTWTQAVAGYLKAVGITLNIKNVSPDQYISSIVSGKYGVVVLPYGALDTYFDFGQLWLPDSGFNPFKTDDKTVTDLYAKAGSATDAASRSDLLKQLNTYVVQQAWWAPTSSDTFGYGYDPAKVTPAPWLGLRPLLLYDWLPAGQ